MCEHVQTQFQNSHVMTKQLQSELDSITGEYHCKKYDQMFLNKIEKIAFKWKNLHETVPSLIMDQ